MAWFVAFGPAARSPSHHGRRATALDGVTEITGAAPQPLGKLEAYAGTAHLADREVLVGGWNLTLAGLTAEQDRQLGKMIAAALGYEP
jgi:hypothetical protein